MPFHQQLAEVKVPGILKPVDHATPWIYSFETANKKQLDKHGEPKLCIFLDLSYQNQAIVREPAYYRIPGRIFQMLSN